MFADPLFWLALSLLLVAVSLTAVLSAAIPALRELSRAARSAEKLFDTLERELPPTLEALRLTSQEITELTDDVSDGMQSAGRVVQQVDQSLVTARQQAQVLNTGSRSLLVGMKTAWQVWMRGDRPVRPSRSKRLGHQRSRIPEPRRSPPVDLQPPRPTARPIPPVKADFHLESKGSPEPIAPRPTTDPHPDPATTPASDP